MYFTVIKYFSTMTLVCGSYVTINTVIAKRNLLLMSGYMEPQILIGSLERSLFKYVLS